VKFSERLKGLRLEADLTQKELADRLSMPLSTYSGYEIDKREPDIETIKLIAAYFDVTTDYLFGRSNDKRGVSLETLEKMLENGEIESEKLAEVVSRFKKASLTLELIDDQHNIAKSFAKSIDNKFTEIKSFSYMPILGYIRAGEPMYAEQNIIDYAPIPEAQLSEGGEYFGLMVVGDSMNNSAIIEGSYVVVRKQEDVENGEIAVVLVDGENATVKIFHRTDNTVTLAPNSSNPEHRPRMIDLSKTEFKVIGKVVMIVRKL
jgi:repressor LexA